MSRATTGERAPAIVGVAWVVLAIATAGTARGQMNLGAGGPPGGQGGGGPGTQAVPAGSTRPTGVSGQVSTELDDFGGMSGGRARGGESLGSPLLPRLPADPGSRAMEEDVLGPPLGAPGAHASNTVPASKERRTGSSVGPSGLLVPSGRGPDPLGFDAVRKRLRDELQVNRRSIEQPSFDPITLGSRAAMDLPLGPEDPGPADGLTLDQAIELMMQQSIDLMALRFEITKSDADILTAGLRSNPIINGAAQLVPYGEYSAQRPGGSGGQPQYGVNVTLPIDITRKRQARVNVAERARRVTEAQLQDYARKMIDELYTAYLNGLAARETLRFALALQEGIGRILDRAEADDRSKQAERRRVDADPRAGDPARQKAARDEEDAGQAAEYLRNQARQAQLQVQQARQMVARSRRQLARMLNIPARQAESLELRGRLRELPELPAPPDELIQAAYRSRPDLAAYRLGLARAQADVRLAKANRLSDIYLVYQPYTDQSGRAFGTKDTYSWGAGVNAALPIFNRNQGNVMLAEANVRQTRLEVQSMERRVVDEVAEAIRDFELSRAAVVEIEQQVLPAARRTRDLAFGRYRRDPSKIDQYTSQQQNYNQVVQQYRNALLQHRQDTLSLNTAVGIRIMP